MSSCQEHLSHAHQCCPGYASVYYSRTSSCHSNHGEVHYSQGVVVALGIYVSPNYPKSLLQNTPSNLMLSRSYPHGGGFIGRMEADTYLAFCARPPVLVGIHWWEKIGYLNQMMSYLQDTKTCGWVRIPCLHETRSHLVRSFLWRTWYWWYLLKAVLWSRYWDSPVPEWWNRARNCRWPEPEETFRGLLDHQNGQRTYKGYGLT